MQERHQNRLRYFMELAATSRDYFIPFIQNYKRIDKGMRVLEIGCGEGGNLAPFSQMGCCTLFRLYFRQKPLFHKSSL